MKLTRQQLQAQIDALKYIVLAEVPALNEAKLNLLLDFATLNESAQKCLATITLAGSRQLQTIFLAN